MNLRFHWMLPKGGEVVVEGTQTPQAAARYRIEATRPTSPAPRPDMKGWTHFAQQAEAAGIDSVLISFSRYEPDPCMTACALGRATEKLKFIAAFRAGLMQPATLVQQINTLSGIIGGRIAINIVAGSSRAEQHGYGDFLSHDERYARAEEFLAICNAFWHNQEAVDFEGPYYQMQGGILHTPFLAPDRIRPETYVSGHSEPARRLAVTQGDCWLRVADTPEVLAPQVARIREQGTEVCLRMCLLCRDTRAEVEETLETLLQDDAIAGQAVSVPIRDDSQMYREAAMMAVADAWRSQTLWMGFVPYFGPVWTTLAGTPEALAEAFLAYKRIGVTQFILSGWPEVATVERFGQAVLPRIREAERQQTRLFA